jgi:hypothetical protein
VHILQPVTLYVCALPFNTQFLFWMSYFQNAVGVGGGG